MIEKRIFEHPIYGTIEKWYKQLPDGSWEFWGYDEIGIINGGKQQGDWINELSN
jgi:hypothetical protein